MISILFAHPPKKRFGCAHQWHLPLLIGAAKTCADSQFLEAGAGADAQLFMRKVMHCCKYGQTGGLGAGIPTIVHSCPLLFWHANKVKNRSVGLCVIGPHKKAPAHLPFTSLYPLSLPTPHKTHAHLSLTAPSPHSFISTCSRMGKAWKKVHP
jgi:hypothetical protein